MPRLTPIHRLANRKSTRKANNRVSRLGFTLVEILIVVIILGILAAIVIPQFTSASTQAKTSNLETQVKTLNTQIQLYRLEHNDSVPDFSTNGWDQLLEATTVGGATTGSDRNFGPYMAEAPINPFRNASGIEIDVASTSTAATGWIWNSTEQRFYGIDESGALIN